MRIKRFAIILVAANVSLCFGWIGSTHEAIADAILSNKYTPIGVKFAKTGWNKENVLKYARECDVRIGIWSPYSEKEIFPMWSSIRNFTRFTNDYLKYAAAGSKTITETYYVDASGRKVDPNTYTGITYKKTVPHTYDGEMLFGVLLHHIADCAVPMNHAPARDVCTANFADECAFEACAALDPVPQNYVGVYRVTFLPGQTKDYATYWNNFCQIFYDRMTDHATRMCTHIWSTPYQFTSSSWISDPCFKEALTLANLVVDKYISSSKEYLR
jgi:hypothetical protein